MLGWHWAEYRVCCWLVNWRILYLLIQMLNLLFPLRKGDLSGKLKLRKTKPRRKRGSGDGGNERNHLHPILKRMLSTISKPSQMERRKCSEHKLMIASLNPT